MKGLGNPFVTRSDRVNALTREPIVTWSTEGSHRQSGLGYVPHRKKSFVSILFTDTTHIDSTIYIPATCFGK